MASPVASGRDPKTRHTLPTEAAHGSDRVRQAGCGQWRRTTPWLFACCRPWRLDRRAADAERRLVDLMPGRLQLSDGALPDRATWGGDGYNRRDLEPGGNGGGRSAASRWRRRTCRPASGTRTGDERRTPRRRGIGASKRTGCCCERLSVLRPTVRSRGHRRRSVSARLGSAVAGERRRTGARGGPSL